MQEIPKISVFKPPLLEEFIRELVPFWEGIFETEYAWIEPLLRGREARQNRDFFYLARRNGRTAGTCHLTISDSNPQLGGLGEVATDPQFRGSGIAGKLCRRAQDDFRDAGGQALFLGTGNSAAARIYSRLGWRKLAGANVMAYIVDGRSPEGFLIDYFKNLGTATVTSASAVDRIPMIPLILCPHDWCIMDANVGIYSTRYIEQLSCMGLYPRYEPLARGDRGAWFSARTDRACTVGLSSARMSESGGCQVDGFTHHEHSEVWENLLDSSMIWAADHGADSCWVRVTDEDEGKVSRCEALGFQKVGVDAPFELNGKQVASVRLERNV